MKTNEIALNKLTAVSREFNSTLDETGNKTKETKQAML
jgi:hypothetical protein